MDENGKDSKYRQGQCRGLHPGTVEKDWTILRYAHRGPWMGFERLLGALPKRFDDSAARPKYDELATGNWLSHVVVSCLHLKYINHVQITLLGRFWGAINGAEEDRGRDKAEGLIIKKKKKKKEEKVITDGVSLWDLVFGNVDTFIPSLTQGRCLVWWSFWTVWTSKIVYTVVH